MPEHTPFQKTPKQREAIDLINEHKHTLLYGGARSAKTTIVCRQLAVRAMRKQSRQLITRFRFNHAKTSIGMDTMPKVMKMCFPDVSYRVDKQEWIFYLPNAQGGESEIWLSGIDDKQRTEKVLGHEYSGIFANEISQIGFEAISQLWHRLAENSGLPLRFIYDENPSGTGRWPYRMFFRGIFPDAEIHNMDVAQMAMNPIDNEANLPPDYIAEVLGNLPKRKKDRFLRGLYLTDVEGALWTDEWVNFAISKPHGQIEKIVVAIDPAVTSNKDSDETGMTVCGLDEFGDGVVMDDLSGKFTTKTWAQRAANAHRDYEANSIIAEVNQGGDLVEDAIHNIDPHIKVHKIHAKHGKFARADPVAMLYEQQKVSHEQSFPKLEEQLTTWVPENSKGSPDRLDSLVYGLSYLMIRESKGVYHFG